MNYHRGGTNTFLSKTHALLPGKNGWHPQPKRASSFPQAWGMSKKLVFFARFWEVLSKKYPFFYLENTLNVNRRSQFTMVPPGSHWFLLACSLLHTSMSVMVLLR